MSKDYMVSYDEVNSDRTQIDPLVVSSNRAPCVEKRFGCKSFPARYSIAIWAFFGFICVYAVRVNLSLAIVAMAAPQSRLNQSVEACPTVKINSTEPTKNYEFDWNPSEQGMILGAFFYGYITTQVIGGNLAEKFGGKWIFGGGILICSILTLLTPVAARIHYSLLIAMRVLMGVASGPVFPAATALWGKWIPVAERSTIPPISQTGGEMGIILTTPLVSIMNGYDFMGGWPSAFYVFGILSLIWFVGWCLFGFNSPNEHPRILENERIFLRNNVPSQSVKHRATPWKQIATCPSIYGLTVMHMAFNFIYYTLLTTLPTYFSTILNFRLQENGFIFAIPYFAIFVATIIIGQIVDRIRVRKILSITVLRKLQTIIGTIGSCGCLIAVGYMECDRFYAVLCCTLAVGFQGFQICGALISHLDIASNYAGTLFGITNTLATIPGFVGPYIVGAVTNHNQTIQAWRLIFNASAGVGIFGCLVYCILFNGEEQKWNRTGDNEDTAESLHT